MVFLALMLILPAPAFGTDTNSVAQKRLAGLTQYDTAVAVSKAGWEKADTAIIATGENYPDALCAAPLASKYDAPVLLTSKNYLSAETQGELKRLGVKTVYIIGGTGVIDTAVKNDLTAQGITVKRLAGETRFDTSVIVAKEVVQNSSATEIMVVTGEDYADAVSVSTIAAHKGIPLLLVPKAYDKVNMLKVEEFIGSIGFSKAYLMGGNEVISDGVASKFSNVERILGTTKYERNIAAVNRFSSVLDLSSVYLATGENYPDALTGSALARRTISPIILVSQNSSATKNYIKENLTKIRQINILGGNVVVPESLIDEILLIGSSNGQVNTRGNTVSNSYNHGIAAIQGDWIYYTDTLEMSGLFKIRTDGSGKTKITDDIVAGINVLGDWIYYANITDDGTLYKIKMDGTARTKLNSDWASEENIVGDWIYYTNVDDNVTLYKIKTDGTSRVKLGDDGAAFLNVINQSIYYANVDDDFKLYKINTDGTGREKLVDDSVTRIYVVDRFVYYVDFTTNRNLYRANIDGTDKTLISRENIKFPNFVGDWVYYSNISDNGYLYKIRLDSTGKTKLNSSLSIDINVVGDWIYYVVPELSGQTDVYKIKLDGSGNQLAR